MFDPISIGILTISVGAIIKGGIFVVGGICIATKTYFVVRKNTSTPANTRQRKNNVYLKKQSKCEIIHNDFHDNGSQGNDSQDNSSQDNGSQGNDSHDNGSQDNGSQDNDSMSTLTTTSNMSNNTNVVPERHAINLDDGSSSGDEEIIFEIGQSIPILTSSDAVSPDESIDSQEYVNVKVDGTTSDDSIYF